MGTILNLVLCVFRGSQPAVRMVRELESERRRERALRQLEAIKQHKVEEHMTQIQDLQRYSNINILE